MSPKAQPKPLLKTHPSSSQDGVMMILKLKIFALLTILHARLQNHKYMSLTLLVDIKLRSSEKHFALLLKDWLDRCSSMEEIQVRKSRPLELLDMLLKLSTFLLEETQFKFLLLLSKSLVPDKIQPELEVEVL